ncbi:MAG: NlpC/P60 family protein [Elusimicrobia bacterium]|nr:NlpC/P60 family protein [Elusimicrobiota bacterium]
MKKTFLFIISYFLFFNFLYSEYYIQAGVFRDKESAKNLLVYLASHNYSATLNFNNNYKVIVGPYKEKEKAEFAVSKLLSEENISANLVDEFNENKTVLAEEDVDISEEVVAELVNFAFDFLGVRYKYGGMDPEKGIDCSYFVQTIYESLGTILPRTSRLQFKIGKKIKLDELMPGDLVFFKKNTYGSRISHVGLYIGNDEFIHASYGAQKVTISSLNEMYFKSRFMGARRPL